MRKMKSRIYENVNKEEGDREKRNLIQNLEYT